MTIHLMDNDNVTNTFLLGQSDSGDSIMWKFQDERFNIEIFTDKDVRTVKKINKSDTIVDSIEKIKHKFLDAAFEYKMNRLINEEDGFDDADEDEGMKVKNIIRIILN